MYTYIIACMLLLNLVSFLPVSGMAPRLNAKVPILRFTANEINVDLNLNRILAVQNTALMRVMAGANPNLVPLVHFIKVFARKEGILNSYTKFMTSYGLTLMAVFFLQCESGSFDLSLCLTERPTLLGQDHHSVGS